MMYIYDKHINRRRTGASMVREGKTEPGLRGGQRDEGSSQSFGLFHQSGASFGFYAALSQRQGGTFGKRAQRGIQGRAYGHQIAQGQIVCRVIIVLFLYIILLLSYNNALFSTLILPCTV